MRLFLASLVLFVATGLFIPVQAQGNTGCSADLPTRLMVGERGRVLLGLPNRIRMTAGINSPYVNNIPANHVFDVVTGPVCADGLTWRQVNYHGVVGWTAEGDSDTYWLEPITRITSDNAGQLTRIRHLGRGALTSDVVWSPDGSTIAAGGTAGIWIYDAQNPEAEPRLLEGAPGSITALKFGLDGRSLISSACSHHGDNYMCNQQE